MTEPKSTYLPTLDGWRAVAISIVVFGHASVSMGLAQFKDVGLLGVQIFFGLSGFLITTLLLQREASTGAISLRDFYTRRVFRILPAAVTYLVTVGLLARSLDITFGRWISTLLIFANYSTAKGSWYLGHFWSLAVEEHFYLIWPAVLLFVRGSRKRLLLSFSLAIIVAFWRALDFKYHWTWTESAWFWGRTDTQADGIIFGVFFALALANDRIGPTIRRIAELKLLAPILIALVFASFLMGPYVGWKLGFCFITIRAAAIPLMILSTIETYGSALGQFLELRPLRFLGLISYSLYLWQQLFLTWEPVRQLEPLQQFPTNVLAAIGCAVLSFYLIETPMIRFGRRFTSALGKPVHRPAYTTR